MVAERTLVRAPWMALLGVLGVLSITVLWFAWPRIVQVEARPPERLPSVSRDETPTTLSAPEAGDASHRNSVASKEFVFGARALALQQEMRRAFDRIWRVSVRAENDAGARFSLQWSTVVATRAHPGLGAIHPVPEPYIAYGAGVWRPRGNQGVLQIFEDAPLFASLVMGDTVIDTIQLLGGEQDVVFAVSESLIEQSKGTFTFRVVDAATGLTPTKGGFNFAAHGIDPGPVRLPFGRKDYTRLGSQIQGPYTLFLGGTYYGERRIEFDIVAGRRNDLGVIELRYTTGIRGQVENPAGEILDIPVIARRSGHPTPVGGGDFKNFGERFYLGSLPPGEIWVTVDSPDWACVPIRFEVHGGILEDAVVPAYEGTPLTLERAYIARGRTRVTILTVDGQVAWHRTLDVGQRATLRLVPGSYTLRSEPGEERTITVAADEQHIEL